MSISDKDLTRSLYNALHRYYCTFDLDWDPEAEEFQIITTPVVAEPYLEEILQGRRKAEQQQERKARHALAQQLSISEWLAGARSEDEAMDLFCEYNNCRYGEDALEEEQRALNASFEEDFGGPKSAMAMLDELPPESRLQFDRAQDQLKRERASQDDPQEQEYDDEDLEAYYASQRRLEEEGLTPDPELLDEEQDRLECEINGHPLDFEERIDYDLNYDDEYFPEYLD